MNAPVFAFEAVGVRKGERTVLEDVTATIETEGITVIVGPSGSGKSTLLRLCNGLDVPTSGTVRHRGRPLGDLDMRVHRREVGMVFQTATALPGTVNDNLAAALGREGSESSAAESEMRLALERVGLGGFGDRRADSLSGGEAQRMCLARTLLTSPNCVLFDEPTSALDANSAVRIENLAHQLSRDDVSCLWVTHDLDQMRRLADHVLVVLDGRIAQGGPISDVLAKPTADVAAFLNGDRS